MNDARKAALDVAFRKQIEDFWRFVLREWENVKRTKEPSFRSLGIHGFLGVDDADS